MSETVVYTAPMVIASEHEVIREGAIAVRSSRVLEVGNTKKIIRVHNSAEVIKCDGILLPPLVNCHTHLELSHLIGIPSPEPDSGMTDWIEDVLEHRQQQQKSPQELQEEYAKALRQQHLAGVILLADITNSSDETLPHSNGCTEVCTLVEMIAPTTHRTEESMKHVESMPSHLQVSPHSPYSTTAALITFLKKRARENNHIFSIHLAESAAEQELLQFQTGEFRQFLEKRESWDGDLLGNISAAGAVHYLQKLDVLDDKTLCVHCVHIREEEIEVLAKNQAKICVCPGSNSFLGVGKAPLETILQAGILPGIGTDSIASNERLDMWREMQILRHQFPDVRAETILAMATQGGAECLHRDNDFGTIEKGKKANFLNVVMDDIEKLTDTEVIETLVSGGKPEKLTWILPANEQ